MGDRVVAVVPAFDEAARVGATVRALAAFCDAVVVVDDGSRDATAERAAEAGAAVVRLERNAGKGAALRRGVAEAADAAVVLLADADLGESAASLRALLPPVLDGDADMTIAAPPAGPPSGLGLVEGLARLGIRAATGRSLARPLSGQRAARADALRRVRIAEGFAVEAAMTIDALRAGLRVVEIPCAFTHARTGRDLAGFAHRARQGAAVAAAVVPRLLRRSGRRGIVRS